MWQVRWKYSCAMLRLTGRRRRNVGPSSISSCLSTRSSRLRLKLCSAFAAADLIALATSLAACFGENSRYASASATFMPFTESATSRAFLGVLRTNFCTAETSIVATLSLLLLDRRRLFGVGAVAERGLAPRRLGVVAGPRLAFATTVGMVARVHRRAADLGTLAEPAAAARLAARLVLVLDVTDLADGRLAADVDPAQLAARHADDGVVALLGQQLRARAGAPHELAATSERELDVDRK